MEVWEVNKMILFLIFVLPGFISLVIYDYIIPKEKRDFSKSIIEIVCYSTLNFIALFPLIYVNVKYDFYNTNTFLLYLSLLVVFIVLPILWPIIFIKITHTKFFKSHFLHPIAKPWDYFFGKKESAWVIVHLKNGKMIGGRYGEDSFASSYPDEEQIYLEKVWKLDPTGVFISEVDQTKGVIVSSSEISSIEFFN